MAFTVNQKEAISFDKGNCLVAAGAGSGKTAVLSERVLELVKNNKCRVDELLILTFTNKAAFEMKERIRNKLAEHIETRSSLDYIDQADITTFDAFALGIVTKYYPLLDFKRAPSLIDESLLNVYRNTKLDEIIETRSKLAYENKDESLLNYETTYFDKDFSSLKSAVLSLLEEAELKEDKLSYINSLVANNTSLEFASNLERKFLSMIRYYLDQANIGISSYENSYLVDADGEYLNKFLYLTSLKELKLTRETNPSLARINKKWEVSEEDKTIREKIVKKNISLACSYFDYDKEYLYQMLNAQKPFMELVVDIANELNASIDKYKRDNLAYSFADIASLARQIINKEEIKSKLRSKYKYIMVDEYQDTSDLQEALLNSLADNNLFAVGDIKQSIYKFRNANPKLFSSKMEEYGKNNGGKLITLAHNFRSREEILDGINNFFLPIMKKDAGGVDYKDNQALLFGNTSYSPSSSKEKYGLKAIVYQSNKYKEKEIEEQAELIASDIVSKIDVFDIFDKDEKKLRKARFSDFAILIDKKKDFETFSKIFTKYHIPLRITFDKSIYDYDVIVLLKNILSLVYEIGKPSLDKEKIKHLYASISRSFIYEESDETIYRNIKENTYLDTPVCQIARSISQKQNSLSLSELVKEIIYSFPILEGILREDNIKANFEQILNFLSKSISSESLDYDIKNYIAYFDSIKTYGNKITIGEPEVKGNLVSLMSIHASKGLEFPIVYLPCLGSNFKLAGSRPNFNKEVGIVFPIVTSFLHKKSNALIDLASFSEEKEDISERMRLLYVAYTRARESLILLIPSDLSCLVNKEEPINEIGKYKNFLSFISASAYESNSKLSISPTYPRKELTPVSNFEKENDIELRRFIPRIEPSLVPPRPSKKSSYIKNYDALIYGTRLHRYLEVVDFASKDLSFIPNENDRIRIKKVLELPIFKDAHKGNRYSEYSYIDPLDGKQGSIDMFIVYPDHIDLFDYKSSNIDDPNYDKQVLSYSSYLERMFKKKVNSYLLSIATCRLRIID